MADDFASHASHLTAPARDGEAVTPSDSVPLARASRGLYVGSAGNLRVTMVSGAVVTFTGVAAGSYYPLRVTQVMATGTTAGSLVALR
jgi:hypothetical protein